MTLEVLNLLMKANHQLYSFSGGSFLFLFKYTYVSLSLSRMLNM